MDFTEMKQAHFSWKVKLRTMIDGTGHQDLDPKTVEVDNGCALGKWIYGEGAKHASKPEYGELKAEHARFHKCAGDVIRQYKAGNVEKAKQMIDAAGAFSDTSNLVITKINKLAKTIT
jgi:hypothetical protein